MRITPPRLPYDRPLLTDKQVERLRVGSKVMGIQCEVYHVLGFVDAGPRFDRLVALATWGRRKRRWFYVVEPVWLLGHRFTPYRRKRDIPRLGVRT